MFNTDVEPFMYDCEALSMLYGVQDSSLDIMKDYMRTTYLLESGADSDIVMESIGDMVNTVVTGIKKFIEKIKEFFKKILLYITSASADLDKVATEVKKVIDGKDINFTISGYNFTVLSKSGPNTSEFDSIVSGYNDDIKDLTKLKVEDIRKETQEWFSEKNLNSMRGKVLGVNNGIPEEDFYEDVRKYYRNGADSTEDITIDKAYVSSIIGHAKRLEDMKKESIKDRDKLISLLTKTENFFNRTVYPIYKDSQTQINVANINVEDKKFSSTDNYVATSDSLSKVISSYVSFKSRQVNKIASMINLVASERANAIKDQIKQERTILRKCLFGNTSPEATKVEDSYLPFLENVMIDPYKDVITVSMENWTEDATLVEESNTIISNNPISDSMSHIGFHGCDYTSLAEQSCIETSMYYDRIILTTLAEEARFILESVNSGEVCYLMEADVTKLSGKIKNAIIQFYEAFIKKIREKAVDERKKWVPWVDDIQKNGLVDKAKAAKVEMIPWWDADYIKYANDISTAIKSAYSNKDYKNFSSVKNIGGIDSLEKINDTNLNNVLKNYFRVGKTEGIKPVTYTGLDKRLDDIISYIKNYDKDITNATTRMQSALETSQKSFNPTTESITADTMLSLLGCRVCESDIVLCNDYNRIFGPVTEADDNNPGQNGGAGQAEAQKVAKAAGGNDETVKNATKVVNAANEEVKQGTGVPEKKTDADGVTYQKAMDRFFKVALTAYTTAREEQFIAYLNVLKVIMGTGFGPKFDDNGNYISIADRTKKDNAETVTDKNEK